MWGTAWSFILNQLEDAFERHASLKAADKSFLNCKEDRQGRRTVKLYYSRTSAMIAGSF
jgi:hypothetical protein